MSKKRDNCKISTGQIVKRGIEKAAKYGGGVSLVAPAAVIPAALIGAFKAGVEAAIEEHDCYENQESK